MPENISNQHLVLIQNPSDQVLAGSDLLQPDTLYSQFIRAALNLDASLLEPYIPEDMQLQDMDKYPFLAFLADFFRAIEQPHPEDWRVERAEFRCGFCHPGAALAGFEVFAGKEWMPYTRFGFMMETDANGSTRDIYMCKALCKD